MADPVISARRAREALGRALATLEGPNVPVEFLAVRQPLAGAIRALEGIENAHPNSLEDQVPVALEAVQGALAVLQQLPASTPELSGAIAGVARSLSLVHGLAELVPRRRSFPPPAGSQTPAPPPSGSVHSSTGARISLSPPPSAGSDFKADLTAANSPTNFYKSAVDADVVERGGVFVATYRAPEVGTEVLLELLLPEGHEFSARAVVRFKRMASEAGPDSPPGFGARLTEISPEGRELIYRYIGNREPLLCDDL